MQKKHYPFILSTIAMAVSAAYADNLAEIVVQSTAEQRDEQGKDDVYQRNITNAYTGKETVERYKGAAPADLFQSFNGVYSGDARNSGAVDPNICGIQGQGRIPVTIDGTEQALTTWRGYNGANNRNYLDPNLIGSITIEKGPDIASGNASGIGGAVKMRTIDVDDIVKAGEKVGVELKLETSNNSVKERIPDFQWGQDYRVVGDGTPGDFSPITLIAPKKKGQWFNDNAVRLAVGVKGVLDGKVDFLAAYSYRQKGNYLAGRGGAHNYEGVVDERSGRDLKQLEPNLPFAASIYRPHTEIPNTSSKMESYLLKTTFHLSPQQTLKLGYRKTHIHYGEIMPSRLDFGEYVGFVPQWPLASVTQQAFNLDYAYRPDNRWLNLNAGFWYTKTISDTNTSGGNPREVKGGYDWEWLLPSTECVEVNENPATPHDYFIINRECLKKYQYIIEKNPNIDGKYNFVNAAQVNAYNTRSGFNLSNTMRLTPQLDLTLSGAFQKEVLTSNHFKATPNPSSTYESPPRAGRRQEWDIAFNFNYRPTDWLVLTAGARYNEYWSYDDYLAYLLKSGRLYDNDKGITRVPTDFILHFREVVNKADFDRYQELYKRSEKLSGDEYWKIRHEIEEVERGKEMPPGAWFSGNSRPRFYGYDSPTRNYDIRIPLGSDGRVHREDNPFYNGTINNEKIIDPKGKLVNRYYFSGSYIDYKEITEQEKLTSVKKRRGHAFSPAFSATAFISDNARVYLRYTQYARMPSIFEDTIGFSASANTVASFKDAYLKPEKANNIELGYVYDFSHLFSEPTKADIKLSYYHNVTKNVIDRDTEFRFVQLEKRILEGLELQARYDNGDYFADLGVEYRLKNKVCDANTAVELDPVEMRVPRCITGGFAWGYLRTQLQPKYSISANLGARLFDRKLEIGSRWNYHSKATNKDENRLWDLKILDNAVWNRPMSWQPVLTVDAYVKYRLAKNVSVELVGTNLTDRYYLDPMTRSMIPAPGRTFKLSLTAKF